MKNIIIAVLLVVSVAPWGGKYTPTFGEHVVLTLRSWYPTNGVTLDVEHMVDNTIRVSIRYDGRNKYGLELAQAVEKRFRSRLEHYLATYWIDRGITIDDFVIETVDQWTPVKFK